MDLAALINEARVIDELKKLASFSDCPEPPPAVTRVVFTSTDHAARQYFLGLCQEANLEIRIDPIGNTFARWPGTDPAASPIATGSHIDAIPHAGMYDGTVGVLGGLEAIRTLQRSGFKPRRAIDLILFTSEEPTRFGIGCSGSRAMAGNLSVQDLVALKDESGKSFNEARLNAGFSGPLESVQLASTAYHAFVELHIEQGPELEAKKLDIGVVSAIAAPASLLFSIDGEGGHAGAVLMPNRRDAMCAAAEMIALIESFALNSPSPDLVATVGIVQVHPGAVNSIPSQVHFTLDIRDIDQANRDHLIQRIIDHSQGIAYRRGVELQIATKNSDPPAIAAKFIMEAIEQTCREYSLTYQAMISRAYHDSLFMARVAPISMIFIPCRDGVSHRADEFSSPEQIHRGIVALAGTLALLAK